MNMYVYIYMDPYQSFSPSKHQTHQNQAFGPLLDALDEASSSSTELVQQQPQQQQQQQESVGDAAAAAADPTTTTSTSSSSSTEQQEQEPPQPDTTSPPLPGPAPVLTRLQTMAQAPTYLRRQLFVHVALSLPGAVKRERVRGLVGQRVLPALWPLAGDGVLVFGFGIIYVCILYVHISLTHMYTYIK